MRGFGTYLSHVLVVSLSKTSHRILYVISPYFRGISIFEEICLGFHNVLLTSIIYEPRREKNRSLGFSTRSDTNRYVQSEDG